MVSKNHIKQYLNKTQLILASALLVLASVPTMLWPQNAGAFSGLGFGTVKYPYRIANCEQLQQIEDDADANYVLTSDMDCSGGFEPIDEFYGVLDGRNYTIDGLSVTVEDGDDDSSYGALFNYVEGAVIKNLYMTNASLEYDEAEEAGIVAGGVESSTVDHIFVQGSISGSGDAGGLFGEFENSSIDAVAFVGSVNNDNGFTGGLVGDMRDSQLSNSYVNATIVGEEGSAPTGGLVGRLSFDTGKNVINSYTTGSVQGGMPAGLIGGIASSGGEITFENLFTVMATFVGPEAPGGSGLIADDSTEEASITYEDVYFDATQVPSVNNCVENQVPEGCTAVNDDSTDPNHFKNSSSVPPLDDWDFTNVWQVTEEYPQLRETTRSTLTEFPNAPDVPITTCEELDNIRFDLNKDYTLGQDLDCGFPSGSPIYEEDFETENDDWLTGGSGDSWHITNETCENENINGSPLGFPSDVFGANGNAGPDCTWEAQEDSTAIGPTIDLPEADNLYLEFDSFGFDEGGNCRRSDYDAKIVKILTNGGETFTILNDCYALHPQVTFDGPEASNLDARLVRFDISDFAGQQIQLAFQYSTGDSCCGNELGWFVDNLKIAEGFVLSPIGSEARRFNGSFDGQGHTISNLAIGSHEFAGLFGYISEQGRVSNLNLAGGSIDSAGDATGAVAGNNSGLIENVTSTMKVSGFDEVGGLVGENDGDINNSSTNSEVESVLFGGGLVGDNNGNIFASSSAGTVTGTNDGLVDVFEEGAMGGLVGANDDSAAIEDSYSTAIVDGYFGTGGLAGINYGEIHRTYSAGSISGFEALGGLVGLNYGPIDLSFTATNIEPDVEASDIGGFAGFDESEGQITNSYYDMERSLTFCVDDHESVDPEGCTGVNGENSDENYFFNNTTNPPLDEWDFENIWQTQTIDYPVLRAFTANDEDLNGDSIPDRLQPYVSGYTSSITGKTVVIDVGEGCELQTDDLVKESDLAAQDPGYDFANGLFNFKAECDEPTITVKLFYYDVSPSGLTLRKHNPDTHAYFNVADVTPVTITEQTINSHNVTVASYSITDGGDLDMEKAVEGLIADPVGLASLVVDAPNTGFRR